MPKINKKEYKVLKGLDDKWEWIARDKNRCLYVFTGKPVKKYGPLLYWGTEGFLSFELFDEKDLFQFIQWEDEEPYNVADLIKEYKSSLIKSTPWTPNSLDFESEDMGMKKNIEWLKEEVLGLRNNGNGETNQTAVEREIGRLQKWAWNNCVDRVYELIDQLDEPEVLSQEWIDSNSVNASHDGVTDEYVHVSDLQNLLVPKQELPVIPKFVADYIEECKRFDESGRKSLYTAMDSMPKEVSEWMTFGVEGFGKGQDLFARAWLDGFTAEEEPKYYIIDKNDEVLWYRDNKGIPKLSGSTLRSVLKSNSKDRYQFTEQEIKDYDERYIPFMVPVDEVAE